MALLRCCDAILAVTCSVNAPPQVETLQNALAMHSLTVGSINFSDVSGGGNQHVCAYCLQFDTRRTPAPQVSLKSQDALRHSYQTARHECNVNRARAEGDTEVHFYHGEHHICATWLYVLFHMLCLV